MPKQFLEKTIEINAPASNVWGMFTDPAFTKQMGGEYVSGWKVGSHLRWKGIDGQMLTDGVILQIEPEKLLKHSLLNPGTTSEEDVMAVLTYEFHEKNENTIIRIREDFTNPITEQEYSDSMEGWVAALLGAKEIAEKRKRWE